VGDHESQTAQTNHNIWSIRNREQQSNHIYYTLLWQVLGFAVPFTSLSKPCKMLGQEPFAKPNEQVLTFLHPTLFAGSHNEHQGSCSQLLSKGLNKRKLPSRK
jgi:hypothetical protein